MSCARAQVLKGGPTGFYTVNWSIQYDSKNRMHADYFNFLCKIQLDQPVHF